MNLLIALFLLLGLFNSFSENRCTCNKAEEWERTYWGDTTDPSVEKTTLRWVQGKVQFPDGQPMGDVLVEVFDNPNALYEAGVHTELLKTKQRRVAVCKTDDKGSFCLAGIPSGKYELRISRERFTTRSIIVKVNSQASGSIDKKLRLYLASNH